jgi:hypothetical protein
VLVILAINLKIKTTVLVVIAHYFIIINLSPILVECKRRDGFSYKRLRKCIVQLEDSIKAYRLANREESSFQTEIDLKQEYTIKNKDAIHIQERYFFFKNISDSILFHGIY